MSVPNRSVEGTVVCSGTRATSSTAVAVKRVVASANLLPASAGVSRIITIPVITQVSNVAVPQISGSNATVLNFQGQSLARVISAPATNIQKPTVVPGTVVSSARRVPIASLNQATALVIRPSTAVQCDRKGNIVTYRERPQPLDFSDMSAYEDVLCSRNQKRKLYDKESPLPSPEYRQSPYLFGGSGRLSDRSKGLRHFSAKVCDKVREKGLTTYNEVADELVSEYFESLQGSSMTQEQQLYDQKNIRRRVYDALNVLMAMNIITKERKEIKWIGLPTSSSQEVYKLEEEKKKRLESIQQKTDKLHELITQQVAFKKLVERNREMEKQIGRPPSTSILYLPFIVVSTSRNTVIDCSISSDKTEYLFTFDQPFLIYDDVDILKRLGMTKGLEPGVSTVADVNHVKRFLPKALHDYIDQHVSNLDMAMLDSVADSFTPLSETPDNRKKGKQKDSNNESRRELFQANSGCNTVQSTERATNSSPDAADIEVAVTMGVASESEQSLEAGHTDNVELRRSARVIIARRTVNTAETIESAATKNIMTVSQPHATTTANQNNTKANLVQRILNLK